MEKLKSCLADIVTVNQDLKTIAIVGRNVVFKREVVERPD
jgi:hypothetical protein